MSSFSIKKISYRYQQGPTGGTVLQYLMANGSILSQVESISGTTAISTNIPLTILTGTTHSMASGNIVGQQKTIINNNENVFSPVFSSITQMTGTGVIVALRYDSVLNRMYVGGNFTTIGGVANTSRIGYYDFTAGTWNAMGTGATNIVYDIQIVGTKVFVCGSFSSMNSVVNTNNIAYWDTSNSTWNAMGTGVITNSGYSSKMVSDGTYLYWYGNFTLLNGITNSSRIARWNIVTAAWSAMGTGISTGLVYDSSIIGTNLYVSGSFTGVGGITDTTYIAKWDVSSSTWLSATIAFTGTMGGGIYTIKADSSSNLVLVGNFTASATQPYNYSVLLNTTTSAITQYGSASPTTIAFTFRDMDNLLWYSGQYSSLGNNVIDYERFYYTNIWSMSFFDTTIGKFCPVFSSGTTQINCMERTNVAGEYWVGGQFSSIDGNILSGLGSLMKLNKNNLIKVDSNLIQNGISNRNSFGMTYKGQTINLVNVNNSKWSVGVNSTSQSVILY